jgi:hypothetical protein
MKYVLEQLCGEKAGPASEASRPEVSGMRVDEFSGGAPPRHRRTLDARDLPLQEVPRQGGPTGSQAMEESEEARTEQGVRALRKSSEGAAGQGSVLLADVCDPIQSGQGQGGACGNENGVLGMQSPDQGQDTSRPEILQSVVCHHSSKFAVDDYRADQLRCAGNGVVPLCAAAAFVELMRTAGLSKT